MCTSSTTMGGGGSPFGVFAVINTFSAGFGGSGFGGGAPPGSLVFDDGVRLRRRGHDRRRRGRNRLGRRRRSGRRGRKCNLHRNGPLYDIRRPVERRIGFRQPQIIGYLRACRYRARNRDVVADAGNRTHPGTHEWDGAHADAVARRAVDKFIKRGVRDGFDFVERFLYRRSAEPPRLIKMRLNGVILVLNAAAGYNFIVAARLSVYMVATKMWFRAT